MTDLVTVNTWRYHTRDDVTTSPAITGALDDALGLIESELDRPLGYVASTTETLTPYRDEWGAWCVQPRRAPIITALSGGVVRGEVEVVGPESPFSVFTSLSYWQDAGRVEPSPVDVTFEGGWKPRGSADHVLPVDLERAICFVAQGLLRESTLAGVTGSANVTGASVGDVSVQFAEAGEGLDRYAAGITCVLERYAYRPYV